MAAVLRKLGFKTRIVYLFDTDGKDGDSSGRIPLSMS
jgi:hypothetical protein